MPSSCVWYPLFVHMYVHVGPGIKLEQICVSDAGGWPSLWQISSIRRFSGF